MLHIGCHLSNAKGYLKMGREAVRIGADTFAFFTRNPRAVVTHPRLRELPFILETPQEDNDGYAREIRMLREIAGEW